MTYAQSYQVPFSEIGFIRILSDCDFVFSGPPRVSEKVVHRQSARIGSAIKLPCPVEGDPPPLIMWTKDGRNIHSGWIRFRILRMGLKIKEVEADDSGTYICKATNGFGSVNINYTLIVIGECRRMFCLCITLENILELSNLSPQLKNQFFKYEVTCLVTKIRETLPLSHLFFIHNSLH